MYNNLKYFYFFISILVIGLLIYIAIFMSNNQYDVLPASELSVTNDYDLFDSDGSLIGNVSDGNLNIPSNTDVFFNYLVPIDIDTDFGLGFSTTHQNFEVTCDNNVIYSFTAKTDNLFGHTPGYGYHIIRHLSDYAGKTLTFKISSPYKMTNTSFSKQYVGTYLDIYRSMININYWAVIIAILTFVFGIIITLYWFITRKKLGSSNVLGYLGVFSIILSIWCINESPLIIFMNHNNIYSAYISFITLMMLPIPFILFIRELYVDKTNILWTLLLALSNINNLVCILLQVFNIYDFKESLIFTQFILVTVIISIFIFTIYDAVKHGVSKEMKLNMICLSGITVCLILDMLFYYFKSSIQNTYIGNIGFLIYIIIIGETAMSSTSTLAAQGKKSELYREMAYKDALTGLFNRTAMNAYIETTNTEKHNYIVAMFDLNNLKQCNDTYGHDEGDLFIETSANLINTCFNSIGSCYRIGGDEFCVIIEDASEDMCMKCIDNLNNQIKETNLAQNTKETISIAYGYTAFDETLDRDLKETRARADSIMYSCKFKMKADML